MVQLYSAAGAAICSFAAREAFALDRGRLALTYTGDGRVAQSLCLQSCNLWLPSDVEPAIRCQFDH
jgi:hypothetical protein